MPFQDIERTLRLIGQITDINFNVITNIPDYGLLEEFHYLPVLTSRGCVFNCNYCAGAKLHGFLQYNPKIVAKSIISAYKKYAVKRFAFYDDALLYNSEKHINIILEKILESGIKCEFYTPNGLHIRFLSDRTAELMKIAGFKDIRLSLESVNPVFMKNEGAKNTILEFKKAIEILRKQGFSQNQIMVYTLANVPGQDPLSIKATLKTAFESGTTPYLAFYSPVPGTPDFIRAKKLTDLSDPLFHNNTVYLYRSGFNLAYYQELKHILREYRLYANKVST
ncbi:MAG: radical SAM protein [Bacteroidetes bacterium]|nr:MAG: radical SAM protein [Bacteroidota bacterium]